MQKLFQYLCMIMKKRINLIDRLRLILQTFLKPLFSFCIMVFESLLNPKLAEEKPFLILLLGFVSTTLGLFLGNYILPRYASLVAVFLTTMFFIPLFYRTMIYEEQKDEEIDDEKSLLKQHSKAIKFFIFLFLGMTLSFMFWFIVFSFGFMDFSARDMFAAQAAEVGSINGKAIYEGDESGITGNVIAKSSIGHLSQIFKNNFVVLIFCVVFSFMYGAGAIFILTWNASVIGYALGSYAVSIIHAAESSFSSFLVGPSCAMLRYFIHGIPEIIAYFVAALAGGILSVAFVKHAWGSEKFERIMADTSLLLLIALGILFIAALLEVFISLEFLKNICII